MNEGFLVKPLVYCLQLEDDKYYVGITYNLNLRYAQHLQGHGSIWTKKYKPICIMEVEQELSEKEKTLEYMEKYGYENVRGACYCKMELNYDPTKNLDIDKKNGT